MACFIITGVPDDARVRLLADIAAQIGLQPALAPDLASLARDRNFTEARRPLVLVPDHGSTDHRLVDDILAAAGGEDEHAFLVYISDTIAPAAYKQLVRTRAADWIGWQALPAELAELVRSLNKADSGEASAKILSCLPSKGGSGNTMLALETGIYLASRRKRTGSRVAVFDLNLQGGTLADSLDVEPRFDIGEITSQPDRLDEQLIDIFTSRHSARLDVFASPARRVDAASIDPQVVFSFLDAISSRYDIIVLDIPSQWLPWIDNVLQGSDAIVVSGGGTVPALKRLASSAAYLDEIGIAAEKIAVAVTQCEADLLGRITRRAEIERTLPGRRIFYVRRDVAAASNALNTGRPLMELAPGNKVSKDIRVVARWAETLTDRPNAPARAKAPTRVPKPRRGGRK